MAKIKSMVADEVISGFKGKLDFYVHRGQPCVRMWPRSPGKRRSAAVEAQWPLFAVAAKLWDQIPEDIRAAYEQMATDTGLSARDMATRAYISGYKKLIATVDELEPSEETRSPFTTLNELLDTDIPEPADGQFLTYNAATQEWKAV
ncbi:hypothetical protein ES703_34470 [subsurface metagenome]